MGSAQSRRAQGGGGWPSPYTCWFGTGSLAEIARAKRSGVGSEYVIEPLSALFALGQACRASCRYPGVNCLWCKAKICDALRCETCLVGMLSRTCKWDDVWLCCNCEQERRGLVVACPCGRIGFPSFEHMPCGDDLECWCQACRQRGTVDVCDQQPWQGLDEEQRKERRKRVEEDRRRQEREDDVDNWRVKMGNMSARPWQRPWPNGC